MPFDLGKGSLPLKEARCGDVAPSHESDPRFPSAPGKVLINQWQLENWDCISAVGGEGHYSKFMD